MIVNKSLSLSGPQFPPVLSLPLWGSNEVMYRPPGSLWVFHKCDLSFLSLDPAPCPYPPNTDVRERALSPPGMGTPTQHGQRNSVLPITANSSRPGDICVLKGDSLHPRGHQSLPHLGHNNCHCCHFLAWFLTPSQVLLCLSLRGVDVTPS